MRKLIEAFRKNPTDANRTRLQTYISRHFMAICMLTREEVEFLEANNFVL